MKKKKIVLAGAGALGVYFASKIPADVYVIARSDRAALLENGGAYRIESEKYGSSLFYPAGILAPDEVPEFAPDYLFVCFKALDGLDQPSLCRNFVRPGTVIVIIENGLGNEEPFRRAFPENEIITAAAYVGVSRPEPGKIHHTDGGRLIFGSYPERTGFTPALTELGSFFADNPAVTVELTEHIQEKRWIKLLWNAAFNPLSVLGNKADTQQIMNNPETCALAEGIMKEICAIAAAGGIIIPEETVSGIMDYTRGFSAYRPSMLQDFLAGRPLEVESILHAPLRFAAEHGVPAPKLETIYALMTLVQRKGTQG